MYLVLAIIVVYGIGIFAFPKYTDYIWEFVGLQEFNEQIREKKQQFEEHLTSYDLFGKLQDTKEKTLEIKQNVSSGVIQTQQKIQEVRVWIEDTRNALNETIESIDRTMDAFGNLKNTVAGWNTASWEIQP